MLPRSIAPALREHLERVRTLHDRDINEGFGTVWLPDALAVKYPNAERAWNWQWVFPAAQRSKDPRSGAVRRHHVGAHFVQRAVQRAARAAGIAKMVGPHTLAFVCDASACGRPRHPNGAGAARPQ